MKNLTDMTITENLSSKVLNIINQDDLGSTVIRLANAAQQKRTKGSTKPKFLVKTTHGDDNTSYMWINVEDMENDDIKATKGIFIEGMYYPLDKASVVEKLINELK